MALLNDYNDSSTAIYNSDVIVWLDSLHTVRHMLVQGQINQLDLIKYMWLEDCIIMAYSDSHSLWSRRVYSNQWQNQG